MNFQLKVLVAVGIAMLGLAIIFTEVDGQTAPDTSMLCNRTQYNFTSPTGTVMWDSCTNKKPGIKYKSCSSCFQNNVTGAFRYRYDFYTCNKCGTTYCMATLNCTGMPIIYINNYTDIYNTFDATQQKCVAPTHIAQNATVPPTPCM